MKPRVVLEHRTGLRQILGTLNQLPGAPTKEALPTSITVDFGDHTSTCSLRESMPRYIRYQEDPL